jgi:hypothetical protein
LPWEWGSVIKANSPPRFGSLLLDFWASRTLSQITFIPYKLLRLWYSVIAAQKDQKTWLPKVHLSVLSARSLPQGGVAGRPCSSLMKMNLPQLTLQIAWTQVIVSIYFSLLAPNHQSSFKVPAWTHLSWGTKDQNGLQGK